MQPIRTISQIKLTIKIPIENSISKYKILSSKVKELKALGLSYRKISYTLGINVKTVMKSDKI